MVIHRLPPSGVGRFAKGSTDENGVDHARAAGVRMSAASAGVGRRASGIGTPESLLLLADLPRNQQEVVRLKFQDGLSYRDIAEITGFTSSNIGYLLHVALKRLRGAISR